MHDLTATAVGFDWDQDAKIPGRPCCTVLCRSNLHYITCQPGDARILSGTISKQGLRRHAGGTVFSRLWGPLAHTRRVCTFRNSYSDHMIAART